jgi:tripartite-type tricarboxylate transporter receptor subunit TctC
MAGIKGTAVPYRGEANTTMAIRSGDVQMLLTSPSAAMLGHVEQGTINMLGVATEKPSNLLPGIPTINSKVPGFNAGIWFGLVAPAGTPDDVVKKIETAVKTAMEDEEIRAKLLPTGAVPKTSTPAEFAKMLKEETEQLRDIITKFDIKAE